MSIQFVGLPTQEVAAIRSSRIDAYANPVEQHRAGDDAYPCRHCLKQTPPGAQFLILAHRPFRTRNPYAETGPIFLCADPCTAAAPSGALPAILNAPRYLLRGYDRDERIVYGTGRITDTARIATLAATLLHDREIAFVDVRSASNNCFQCRVQRG